MPVAASDYRIHGFRSDVVNVVQGEAMKAKGYLQRNHRGELL